MHVHPFFSIAGIICCYLLMLWLIPTAIHLVSRWKSRSKADVAMVVLCLFVTLAIVLPDAFIARPR
jgi:predicted RND superfamily exporter protein